MLVKIVLLPYQQCLMQGNNDTSVFNKIKLHKLKDFYNMLKFQSTPKANMTRIDQQLFDPIL